VKFLIDHQLPPALAGFFRERRYQCQHLLDIGMASSSDAEIYQYAISKQFIIVTKDEDFLYLSAAKIPTSRCSGFDSEIAAPKSSWQRWIGNGPTLSAVSSRVIASSRFVDYCSTTSRSKNFISK
jgi:uncharacterized protein DUF5615